MALEDFEFGFGVDGGDVGVVDPNQPAVWSAQPNRHWQRIEKRPARTDVAGERCVLLVDPGKLELIAGDVLQAQNGAPAGGAAFSFDRASCGRLENDVERAAVDEKLVECGLERLRGVCFEPLAEAQNVRTVRQAARQLR